ncbi:aminoglycoside N(3)-acetyltransferase [Isoptericola sp. NPDC057653]|uniref:aminoglycoside N(3)-acetyltransferase n=1 Tax=Isoptericola sp. NPDC057653 TaxID=3346195 RepID=UPI0036C52866
MATSGALRHDEILDGWRALGVRAGDVLLVHASLSAFGPVAGGAATVVDSLCEAVGVSGTLVMPAFTPQIADPDPTVPGPPTPDVRARRDAVPLFTPATPSRMGAVAEELRAREGTLRSSHPQVSVVAHGPAASRVVARQSLAYGVGESSPFGAVRALGGRVLLIGVGHNRNTFLHHAEGRTPHHRRKLRRFPTLVAGERAWVETPDVADDLDTLFPVVGAEFEARGTTATLTVGGAVCRLFDADELVRFATGRFDELLRPGVAEPAV